jgi:hypothetical protein
MVFSIPNKKSATSGNFFWISSFVCGAAVSILRSTKGILARLSSESLYHEWIDPNGKLPDKN